MAFIYLVIAFILNSLANILLKINANAGFKFTGINWSTISGNYFFFFGIILFAVNVIFYFLALRNISLTLAYPIMVGMSFFIINSYAYFFLGEKINAMQIFGYFLIVLGIVTVLYFARK